MLKTRFSGEKTFKIVSKRSLSKNTSKRVFSFSQLFQTHEMHAVFEEKYAYFIFGCSVYGTTIPHVYL